MTFVSLGFSLLPISDTVWVLSVFWVFCSSMSVVFLPGEVFGLLNRIATAVLTNPFLQWFDVWPVCLHEKHVTVSSDKNIRYSVWSKCNKIELGILSLCSRCIYT